MLVEELEEPSAAGDITRARLPVLDTETLEGFGVDVEGVGEVGELAGGDPVDVDLWDVEGEFTGFKMQRFTCLFRLDATPNRRPHVSQTNAIQKSQLRSQLLDGHEPYPFHQYGRGDAISDIPIKRSIFSNTE